MSWVKLDDRFAEHPKVLAAGPLAAWLYTAGVCYAAQQLTDGFIPSGKAMRLADIDEPAKHAETLVSVGLWERVEGGYQIHDYHDYNPPAAKVKADRAADAQRKAQGRGVQPDSARTDRANGQVIAAPRPAGIQASRTRTNPVPGPVVIPSPSLAEEDAAQSAQPQPPPEELQTFHAILGRLKGYEPSPEFYAKLLATYGRLDLEQEALKMADWLRTKPRRDCSTRFVLNWLADELSKLEAKTNGRNGRHAGSGSSVLANAAGPSEDTLAYFRKLDTGIHVRA